MLSLNNLVVAVSLFAALGSGIMAGLFFTFSNFLMRALASLSPDKGIAVMQAINIAILNPLFFLVFFGTAIACLGATVFAIVHWGEPGALCLLLGSLLYLGGVILVTMIFNVPRNDALAALDPISPASLDAWRGYLSGWTAWNHVRSVAALAATASFIMGFCQLRRIVF